MGAKRFRLQHDDTSDEKSTGDGTQRLNKTKQVNTEALYSIGHVSS